MAVAPSQDLRPLFDNVLQPRLAALERERVVLKHAIVGAGLLVGLPLFVTFCGPADALALAAPAGIRGWITPLSFLLIFVGVVIAAKRYGASGFAAYMNYRSRFKREVVAEIFRVVSPGADYQPFNAITQATFEASGIFYNHGAVRGDDLVRGRIGETAFEACEIDRHYETGGKDSKTVSVFHGLFFHIDFNKAVQGHTIVQPQRHENISLGSRTGLERVTLEDPSFEALFDVYSDNSLEARYILTPLLMERIVEIHQTTKRPICLAFSKNRAFVAVQYGRALFEPSIRETTSFESLLEMAEHFRLAELVVNELDLNTRIWTKDVDAGLLAEAPAVNPLAALTTGNLTAGSLMQQAAGQMYVDADQGPPPERPSRTRARIEHEGGTTVIRYRLAWWAVMCLLLSLPFAAAAVAGAAMLVAPDSMLGFAGIVSEDGADAIRRAAPIVLGVSVLLGGFIALYWITYVRRVVIDSGEIRVRRGINPFARRYPRSEDTRILQADRYLYLGSANRTKLINPSLSPILPSADEARWLAHEMRRALRGG